MVSDHIGDMPHSRLASLIFVSPFILPAVIYRQADSDDEAEGLKRDVERCTAFELRLFRTGKGIVGEYGEALSLIAS